MLQIYQLQGTNQVLHVRGSCTSSNFLDTFMSFEYSKSYHILHQDFFHGAVLDYIIIYSLSPLLLSQSHLTGLILLGNDWR